MSMEMVTGQMMMMMVVKTSSFGGQIGGRWFRRWRSRIIIGARRSELTFGCFPHNGVNGEANFGPVGCRQFSGCGCQRHHNNLREVCPLTGYNW